MAMKYVSAYLMCVLGGTDKPTAANVKKVLSSIGCETEDDVINNLIKAVGDKPAHELIAGGMSKLQSMTSAAPAAGVAPSAAPAAVDKKEEKGKKKEEEEEEEEGDMGFSLFD